MRIEMVRFNARVLCGATTEERLGKGVDLSRVYLKRALTTRLTFYKPIDRLNKYLREGTVFKCFNPLPLCRAEFTLRGKVQGVVMRGVIVSIVKALVKKGEGLEGAAVNREDGSVTFTVRTDPVRLLAINELLGRGRRFQVVVGPAKGLETNSWVVTPSDAYVPREAEQVRLPYIQKAEARITFEGEGLPTQLQGEFDLSTFPARAWPMLVDHFFKEGVFEKAFFRREAELIPQTVAEMLEGITP